MSTPTKNINAEKIQGNLAINSITASTISATTYQNLPLDIRVTGATYNNNTFTYTNNTGDTFSVLFNSVTGLTVNGGLSATTLYGDGSNITGINFSQLATTAHTHSISDVINLQTNLDGKIDKPASPFLGDYLYYNGITWVPNQVNIPVSAGAGVTLFLSITGSSLPTYEYLSQFPIELTESQEPVTVNNSQALIGKYATEQLNRTVVDLGIWEFNTYASVDIPSTGLTQIIVTAYLLTTGNTETFLFSASTENITTTAATLYTISVVEPQYSCSTSDYLVVNYSASTTNNFNTVVTLYHGGNINYSHIHTPFVTLHNDLAGLQGGLSNQYYHLSKNEVDLLTTSVDASSIHNHDSLYLGLGGGTITGNTEVAGSFSASTYLGLPIDVFITGSTYNNANQFTFTNNTGGTFNVSFNQVTGLTATTISANTYQNLPVSVDTFVTGFTYSSNTFTLNRNQNLPNLTATINSVTGLTINGSLFSNSISATTISGGTFYGDGSGLTNLPSAPSGKFGIPNSAGTYTFYSNLAAAMSAATSGQTIEMFTDVTESGTTAITLKSGVSINGHGHIYTFTPTTSNVFNFIDGGVAVNFNFFNITLRKSGTQTGGGVLGLSVSNSIINGLSTKIIVDTPSSYGISNYGGTVFAGYVNGFEIISNVATSMSVSLIRGTIVNCRLISNSTTGTALINLGSINNSFVQCTSSGYGVNLSNTSTIANNIISYSNTGVAVAGGLLNNSTVYSSGGYGVSGTNVRNCTIISDGNIAAYLSNIYNSSVYSTSNVGAFIQNQTITTSTIISTANSGVQLFDASNISTSYISTTSANPALLFSNNSLTSKAKNCTIVNTANSASGHGVRFNFTNAYLLDCQIQVANTSANCMYAASAFAVRYAGCKFEGATTSINANITQAITNTPDSQGNIIIN